MKGFCFLDYNGVLNYRTHEYITSVNPGFWQDNEGSVLRCWQFDTDNISTMYAMYDSFRVLRLKADMVKEFSKQINFSTDTLKNYAGSVQPR